MSQVAPTNNKAAPAKKAPVVPPTAGPARPRRRHRLALLSAFFIVVVPVGVLAFYLWFVAASQFSSTVGFSVRKEEVGSAVEILGGITELSGSSSSDTDILYEYIQSQKMVTLVDDQLDLRSLWSKPAFDPVFAYDSDGTIEDLIDYWGKMVRVYYDSGSGLIEVRVLAFDPDDAQKIAQAIFVESSDMINELSAVAREDAVRYARDELDTAVERLKSAREAITRFRNDNRIVDPTVDLQTQEGLLGTLQTQLAEALIDLDLLLATSQNNDPRVGNAERRVEVIQVRIEEERRKRGIRGDADDGESFTTLVGEYERLVVDREFAEQTYVSSLAARDAALAEARRQSRYLAAHIQPTLAERSLFPQRVTILGLFALFMFMAWAISVLVAYSLKDRR
ncbi:capsule biosynthesis protein [Sulfitobacter sp.]|uniref:capsule biosynthesis protein n=1 Tax=Sulfitobacter sp. TaxID=1903071 RepID=UPI0032990F7A